MNAIAWRAYENRLYVRLLVARKLPDLAAALGHVGHVICPRCGGILVEIPACTRTTRPVR